MAWLAGDDPLAFHRRILEEGTPHFAAGAAVVLEAGSGAGEFARFAEARRPGASARVLRDLAGAPRVVSVSLPA
jgi:hypothetical protein